MSEELSKKELAALSASCSLQVDAESGEENIFTTFENEQERGETWQRKILRMVIDGIKQPTGIGSMDIDIAASTEERKMKYLMEYDNDSDAAINACIEHNHGRWAFIKRALVEAIPVAGLGASLLSPKWRELRDVALIAALTGHDLESEDTQTNIMLCCSWGCSAVAPTILKTTTAPVAGRVIQQAVTPTITTVASSVAAKQEPRCWLTTLA